jgi:uncharacterized cupredoxin-like copper-binding protein
MAAAALASCSGTAARPSGPIVPGTPAHPRDVNVILRDYVFVPTPILLVPGETVRLNVIDGGLVTHELVLGDASVQDAYEREEAAHTPPVFGATAPPFSLPPALRGLRIKLDSGQSASVIYHVPAEGPPPLLACHIPGHLARGMVGQVEYVSPDRLAEPSGS